MSNHEITFFFYLSLRNLRMWVWTKHAIHGLFFFFQTKGGSRHFQTGEEAKKQCKVCDATEPPRPLHPKPYKAVDEDLYKIPSELLSRRVGYFTPLFIIFYLLISTYVVCSVNIFLSYCYSSGNIFPRKLLIMALVNKSVHVGNIY